MDLLQSVGESYGAAQSDHWVALGISCCKAGDEIGDAGARSSDRYSSFAGHASNASSNKGCILLMPADDRLYRRIDKRIEDLVDLRARNSEYPLHIMLFERFDDDICTRLLLTLFLVR